MSWGKLLFSLEGRILRGQFAMGFVLVTLVFIGLFLALSNVAGGMALWVVYPVVYWCFIALAVKRCHDFGKSGSRLFIALIPLLGLIWILAELFLKRGTHGENRYGAEPIYSGLDHHVVPSEGNLIRDVTQLNPVEVAAVIAPKSIEEVQAALERSSGPVCIGGGRFSMGGQTASPGAVQLDMRGMNQIVSLSPLNKTIRAQAGARWCDLQEALDAHDLAIKTMQTYANFTVGGSIGVNCHGRYVGYGPLVLSVRALKLVLHDGTVAECSREENSELFFGAIGGYGALGVVVEVELNVVDNVRVERKSKKLGSVEYLEHFKQQVRDSPKAQFHNADIYPPHFKELRSVTWFETEEPVTNPKRLLRAEPSNLVYRYLFWMASETPLGKWRREKIYEPLFYMGKTIHWRNYEAGYDVAEIEPGSRDKKTYVLQEYFVPVGRFDEFVPKMAKVFQRYEVNVVNCSVRHALPDDGTLLAWAPEEVFAFVIYYKQGTDQTAQNHVATWTRAMIDAIIECGGAYYLPYQAHATPEQFHKCYPRAEELFRLKQRVDPEFRFRNVLWDKYYTPWIEAHAHDDPETVQAAQQAAKQEVSPSRLTALVGKPPEFDGFDRAPSEFHDIFDSDKWRDQFYLFLQNIYRLYPEADFHQLIADCTAQHQSDEAIYRAIQEGLKKITPALAPVRYALPALAKQKDVIATQTMELLDGRDTIDGYLEIGSTGRYISELDDRVKVKGPVYLINDKPPTNSPDDIVDRGGIKQAGEFFPLGDYEGFTEDQIASESLDVVTCYIGLHHSPRENLDGFVNSIVRSLRPGGLFILRDHDVKDEPMRCFVSLVHTVFNCGLKESWAFDQEERRHFTSCDEISSYLAERGLEAQGPRLLQEHDPSINLLMAFKKV